MANFSKLVTTNKGKELIAKVLANTAVIRFTKVSASGMAYREEELEDLTDLDDIRQTSLVSDVSLTNNTSVEIQVSFTNTELTEGYYLRALGLYAEHPDAGEILYGVTAETSGNCYIPAYNGVTSSGLYLQFVTTVGNAENVSLEINPAAIATIKDVQKVEEKLKILDFDDSGEVEGIESFTDFIDSFVKGTSIYQFLANLRAGLKYVLHAGQLVNSGMCETPGMFPLDAAFGKTLQDQITGLYSEIRMKSAVLTGTCELREVKSGSISNFETDVEISSLNGYPSDIKKIICVEYAGCYCSDKSGIVLRINENTLRILGNIKGSFNIICQILYTTT